MIIQIALQTYQKYVTVDKEGTPILYMKLQKALYGLMRASLLFYRKLQKELEQYGFEVNLYNPCIVHMTTSSGEPMAVIWHVDNSMGTCTEDFKLMKFSCYSAKIYGPKLSMHTGNKHNYLGVDLEFNDDVTLNVSMVNYLKSVIVEFPEMITGKAAMPAANHLWTRKSPERSKKKEHSYSTTQLHNCYLCQQELGATYRRQ